MSSKKLGEILTREITVSDFDAVAEFLGNGIGYVHEYFLHLLQFMAQHPTPAGFPKYGRLLESDGAIVELLDCWRHNSYIFNDLVRRYSYGPMSCLRLVRRTRL